MSTHVELRPGAYADSVTLLQVSRAVQGVEGVATAQVAMATPLNVEQSRWTPFGPYLVIPEDQRPRTIVRFGDADELLISGLLQNGSALAEHAAVVDARVGKGHSLLFAINPIWRGETVGSYALVFNAILNFDRLSPAAEAGAAAKKR